MRATANKLRSALLVAALSLCASGAANAVGWATQLSCASDYYAYCSKHSIGTPGVAACMRANGERLSKACINALIADGEISKADVEKQKAKIAAAKAGRKPAESQTAKAVPKAAVAPKATVAAKPAAQPKAVAAEHSKAKPKPEREAIAALTPPKPKLVRVGRKPDAASVATLALDAATYDALKNREARFVAASETELAAAGPAALAPSRTTAWGPADMQAAMYRSSADPRVEKSAPAQTTVADANRVVPAVKPIPGRMSLGSKTTSDEPEARAPKWWDALVEALFGAAE